MSRTVLRSIAVAGVAALTLAIPVAANAKTHGPTTTAHQSAATHGHGHGQGKPAVKGAHSKKVKAKSFTVTGVVGSGATASASPSASVTATDTTATVTAPTSTVTSSASTDTAGGTLVITVKGGTRALHGKVITITVTAATVIRRGGHRVAVADLVAGDHVSVRGVIVGTGDAATYTATRINAAPVVTPTASPTGATSSAAPSESESESAPAAPTETATNS